MRISTVVYSALIFCVAIALSVLTAMLAATTIEDVSRADVRRALSAEGLNWADADADGLQVFVIGNAPDEATRFKARSIAGTVVDAARVIDQMNVIESRDIAPPEFRLEILRSASGISVFGVLPRRYGVDGLLAALRGMVGDNQRVTDLLEMAEYPAPENWTATVRFALEMVEDLEVAKLSVTAANVQGDAVAQSQEQKRTLETKWARRKPEGVSYRVTLTAPRPIVSPYAFRAVKRNNTLKFDACTAQTAVSRGQIFKAATELGLDDKPSCQLALGRPTDAWPQVVIKSLNALGKLDDASVTIADTSIKIVAGEGTDKEKFDAVIASLKSALPAEYALTSELPMPKGQEQAIPDFTIVRSPEGLVQLWGSVSSTVSYDMIKSVAVARFGKDKTNFAVKVDPDLPVDWTPQILGTLDAIDVLNKGTAIISSNQISVTGTSEQATARADISLVYGSKTAPNQSVVLDITYVEPEVILPEGPSAQDCVEEINSLLETRKINFEPGSDRVDLEGQKLLDDIAEVLGQCGAIPLEIAGHTDSQGREEMNRALSQSRANAVLLELQRRRILTSEFVAKGYGETRPIAPNDSEEGREKNRRIEFLLLTPEADKPASSDAQEASKNE